VDELPDGPGLEFFQGVPGEAQGLGVGVDQPGGLGPGGVFRLPHEDEGRGGLRQGAEAALRLHLFRDLVGVPGEKAGFGVVDEGVPEPDPGLLFPVPEAVGVDLHFTWLRYRPAQGGLKPGPVLGVDLGKIEGGVGEEGFRRVAQEGFRLGRGGVDEGGVGGVLALLHLGLVDRPRKGGQHPLQPGPLRLQLADVLDLEDDGPHRLVLEEVPAPHPHRPHPALLVQDAQAVLQGGPRVAEEVLQGRLGEKPVFGVNVVQNKWPRPRVLPGQVAQHLPHVGGDVEDPPLFVQEVDELPAAFQKGLEAAGGGPFGSGFGLFRPGFPEGQEVDQEPGEGHEEEPFGRLPEGEGFGLRKEGQKEPIASQDPEEGKEGVG
jgi:hypothetical protein